MIRKLIYMSLISSFSILVLSGIANAQFGQQVTFTATVTADTIYGSFPLPPAGNYKKVTIHFYKTNPEACQSSPIDLATAQVITPESIDLKYDEESGNMEFSWTVEREYEPSCRVLYFKFPDSDEHVEFRRSLSFVPVKGPGRSAEKLEPYLQLTMSNTMISGW